MQASSSPEDPTPSQIPWCCWLGAGQQRAGILGLWLSSWVAGGAPPAPSLDLSPVPALPGAAAHGDGAGRVVPAGDVLGPGPGEALWSVQGGRNGVDVSKHHVCAPSPTSPRVSPFFHADVPWLFMDRLLVHQPLPHTEQICPKTPDLGLKSLRAGDAIRMGTRRGAAPC